MALQVNLAGSCPQMLAYMREIAGKAYAFDKDRATGTLDYLLGPAGGGAKIDLTSVQIGKKYVTTKVHYKLRTRQCDVLLDDSVLGLCDTPETPAELSTTIQITKRVGTRPKKFTNDQMINICQDTQAFIREYVLSDMKALRWAANDIMLAKIDAGSGDNHRYDGMVVPESQNVSLQLLGTSTETNTQVPLYANFNKLVLDYQQNQGNGMPNLIGQGILHEFMTLKGWSCCNSSYVSYDAAIANGVAYYFDQGANRVLGANEFLVVEPGAASLLWFNRNRNININNDLVQHLVLPDSKYGNRIGWDFDFKWDECTKSWIYTLSADLDLFTLPSDQYGSPDLSSPVCQDDLVGTTGIFKYRATSA